MVRCSHGLLVLYRKYSGMGWQDRVDELSKKRLDANGPVWDLISKIKEDRSLRAETQERYLAKLYNALSDKDVRQEMVMDSTKFEIGTSFRASLNHLRRTKDFMHRYGTSLFPGDNDKEKDRIFGGLLDIAIPENFQLDVPLKHIELVPQSILKPLIGTSSFAVFYVNHDLRLRSVRTARNYESLEEAYGEIRRFGEHISSNRWVVEEAILGPTGEPANDFKVFSFYGTVGMALEIDRTSSQQPRIAAYDENGNHIKRNLLEHTFKGSGIPSGAYEIADKISLASPVPFLRIDFHIGEDRIYLGEITPQPGGMHADRIYENLDRSLGRHFAEAEARLYIDMLDGKPFSEFREAYRHQSSLF